MSKGINDFHFYVLGTNTNVSPSWLTISLHNSYVRILTNYNANGLIFIALSTIYKLDFNFSDTNYDACPIYFTVSNTISSLDFNTFDKKFMSFITK